MKEYIIRLIPKANFEIIPHSDTIFGAICWAILTLFGEKKLTQILEDFNNSPPFLISSAFPWKQVGNRKHYYLPKPYMCPLSISALEKLKNKSRCKIKPYSKADKLYLMDILEQYKRFKKLRWIPLYAFKKIQKGGSEKDLFCDFLDGLITKPKFIESGIVQKNKLDRLSFSTSGSGEVFFQNELSFRESWGLYFLLKTNNLEEYLKPAFLYLQDSGIGPNARTGKNWFKVEIEETSLFEDISKTDTNTFVTLSRFIGIDEIDVDNSWYEIETVRSKVESRFEFAGEDIWKAQVMYFSAGSVIRPKEKKDFYGGLIPVKKLNGRTIYQYGYAYPVYIKEKRE